MPVRIVPEAKSSDFAVFWAERAQGDTQMSDEPVLFSLQGGVRDDHAQPAPEMNALNPEMIVRLARYWDQVDADATDTRRDPDGRRRANVSAPGADLGRLTPLLTAARGAEDEWDEALPRGAENPESRNAAANRFHDAGDRRLSRHRRAGGMELALACDLRIVAEDSTLGLSEVKRGLIPAAGGIARVSRQVSWAAAAEILLIGDRISAADALRIGLVNRVVPGDAVLATAQALAETMGQNSPLAMRKAKEAMVASSGRSLDEAFGVEDQCIKVVLRSEDAREGSKAFMEKRRPNFTGR
jgi:enoyl-CoA hydratase/carnithine racemase